jgi:hypothetical protein
MSQFYVTVTKTWNLVVDAEDEAEAQELGVEDTNFLDEDFIDVVECSEVKRNVE